MDWKKLLNFDKLIMPSVIKVIYVIMSIGIILGGLAIPGDQFPPLMRILGILGGLLGVRLYCELIIVLFKISENTSKFVSEKS